MESRGADGNEQMQRHRAFGVIAESQPCGIVVRSNMLGKVCVNRGPAVMVVGIVSAQMGMNEWRAECGSLHGNRQPNRDQSPQHTDIIGPGSG
jgi:hypothetical protein